MEKISSYIKNWNWNPGEEKIDFPFDSVSNPSHYSKLESYCKCGEKYETRKITQELPMNKGCAIKYIVRSGHKGDEVEDLKKAKQFIDFEIDRIGEKDCRDRKEASVRFG